MTHLSIAVEMTPAALDALTSKTGDPSFDHGGLRRGGNRRIYEDEGSPLQKDGGYFKSASSAAIVARPPRLRPLATPTESSEVTAATRRLDADTGEGPWTVTFRPGSK